MATLSSLSRGIYPRTLSEEGLIPALRAAVATSAIPVTVTSHQVARLPASVETALYFCCMEAVQNAAKHSAAGTVTVRLSDDRGVWRLVVADDGTGFDSARAHLNGVGLANMRDRLDAVSGTVEIRSDAGGGTTVTASVVKTVDPPRTAAGMPGPVPSRGG
jgi:signal transduction histidine kinase